MGDKKCLILIFKNKKFQIPDVFLSENDISQVIFNTLKIKGEYEITSKVTDEVFKSFINHWIYGKIPLINLNNIYEYEQISNEFDRMHDIIELYQQKKKDIIISPILRQNQELRGKCAEKINSFNDKNTKYQQIIHTLFNNSNNFITKVRSNEINKVLLTECQLENIEHIDLLTKNEIKFLGFSFILNKKEKTVILFHNDSSNEDIFIPRSFKYKKEEFIITNIAENSFSNERNIKTINFSEDSEIKTIGKSAFSSTLIEHIIIPSSVTCICEFAFSNCIRLQTIEISQNSELKIIEKNAFAFSPIKSISIPSSIEKLKDGWCCGTINLKSIKIFPNKNKNNICLYNDDFILGKSNNEIKIFDVLLFARRDIENAEIPDFVKVISQYAFHKCVNLKNVSFSENSELEIIDESSFPFSSIEKILIPKHVRRICESSFSCCYNLNNVNFANNSELKIIEKSSFACSSLEKISIPPHLNRIEEFSFSSCYQLKIFEIPENSELISIEKNAFVSCAIENLSIPSSLIEFKSTFSNLKNIKIIPNDIKNISYYDEKLILGKSDIKSGIFDIIYFARRDIKNVKIPSFIKQIAPYAFNECKSFQKVEFSEDSELNSIEYFSFSNSSIQFITIPSSVIKIGGKAFFNCDELNKVNFLSNSNLLSIEDYSFSNSKIEAISIPSGVNRIGEFAFSCCHFLKKITFLENSNLNLIDKSSFYFTSINNILIPANVTKIGNLAFSYCQNLKIIEISEMSNLQSINRESFDITSKIILMTPAKLLSIKK